MGYIFQLFNTHALTASAAQGVHYAHHASLSSHAAAILSIILIAVLILIAVGVLVIVGTWKLFKKAGQPGWAAIVPFYRMVKLIEIANKPLWWIVLMCIPIVNFVLYVIVLHRISLAFGKGGWFTLGLVVLPFIFFPIIGMGSASYRNTFPSPRPMSEAAKWALIGAAVFFVFEGFFLIGGSSSSHFEPLTVISSSEGETYATDGVYVYANDQLIQGADPATFVTEGDYEMDAGSVYYEGVQIPGADAASFQVLIAQGNYTDYAKDDMNAYYEGTVVVGADPTTFEALDTDYAKDSQQAYDDGESMPGVDVSSFKVLGGGYAADSMHVYYISNYNNAGTDTSTGPYDEVVSGADPSTFVVEAGTAPNGASYDAKDANHYYYEGEYATPQNED